MTTTQRPGPTGANGSGVDHDADNPTSLEIFSGAGGLALGIEKAGFRHVALVEWDRDSCETLCENAHRRAVFGHGWPVFEQDVSTFDYSPYAHRITLLAGGAPCQPFSLGGLQRGDRDHRNLFPEVFRGLREVLPRAILLENVRNIAGRTFRYYFDYIELQLQFPFIQPEDDEDWRNHKHRLDALDTETRFGSPPASPSYAVEHVTINAADYGVPQIRHRVFIVGFRRDLGIEPAFPVATHSEAALLWAQWVDHSYWREHRLPVPETPNALTVRLRKLASGPKPDCERWQTLRDALAQRPPLPEPTLEEPASFQKHRLIPGARVYEGHTGNVLDRPAKTIKAGDHGNPGGEHVLVRGPDDVRYLTIRECARVQTFPDDYHFMGSRTECMRQLGNAVPVKLAHTLASTVREQLDTLAEGQSRVPTKSARTAVASR